MKDLERQLKALANRRRLTILKYLKAAKAAAVSDIAQHIRLSLTSTSKHLNILEKADLLEKDQRSTQVFYHLAPSQKPFVSSLFNEL